MMEKILVMLSLSLLASNITHCGDMVNSAGCRKSRSSDAFTRMVQDPDFQAGATDAADKFAREVGAAMGQWCQSQPDEAGRQMCQELSSVFTRGSVEDQMNVAVAFLDIYAKKAFRCPHGGRHVDRRFLSGFVGTVANVTFKAFADGLKDERNHEQGSNS